MESDAIGLMVVNLELEEEARSHYLGKGYMAQTLGKRRKKITWKEQLLEIRVSETGPSS